MNNLLKNTTFLFLFKLYLYFDIIACIIIINYYVATMTLLILFRENKIKIPTYLPQFILEWPSLIKKLNTKKIDYYLLHFCKLIFVYLFVLSLAVASLIYLF